MRLSENKIKHVHAVAEYMYDHAKEYDLDPEKMYIVGLLHDIGYIGTKKGHSEYGADLLARIGFDERMSYAIRNHGSDLSTIDVTQELLLLVKADLQIDYEGEFVGFEARIEGIKIRYGEESNVYKRVKGTEKYLREKGEIK